MRCLVCKKPADSWAHPECAMIIMKGSELAEMAVAKHQSE